MAELTGFTQHEQEHINEALTDFTPKEQGLIKEVLSLDYILEDFEKRKREVLRFVFCSVVLVAIIYITS
jgi:hypothetical protein